MVSEETEVKTGREAEVKTYQPVRFRFRKIGRLQYISHLDLLRTVEHAVLRAELPVRYSEGFNPHAKLAFAMPLSVGTESVCEFLDTALLRGTDPEQARVALSAQLPPELAMFGVSAPVHPFTDIGYALYEITLRGAFATDAVAASMEALYRAPLPVLKRTKSGEREVDIAPLIHSVTCSAKDAVITANAMISASPAAFLNPDYLLRAARDRLGLPLDDPEAAYSTVMRRAVFLADGVTPFA